MLSVPCPATFCTRRGAPVRWTAGVGVDLSGEVAEVAHEMLAWGPEQGSERGRKHKLVAKATLVKIRLRAPIRQAPVSVAEDDTARTLF